MTDRRSTSGARARPATPHGDPVGKYEIVARLAEGRRTDVYLALARGHGGFTRAVALKRMRPAAERADTFARLLLHEARISGFLSHPNLIQVHDIEEDQSGSYFLVMEYVKGWSLRSIIATAALTRTVIPIDVAVSIARDIACGLHAAHEVRGPGEQPLGLVHRDVTPSNILVSHTGSAKLIDFGNATTERMERAQPGLVYRTTRYAPPELIQQEPVDRRADIYSLGLILYEITTGVQPFDGDRPVQRIISGAPRPTEQRGDYPPALESIVLRAMHPDPKQRYHDAEQLQLDLEGFAVDIGFPLSTPRVARFLERLFGDADAGPERGANNGKTRIRLNRRPVDLRAQTEPFVRKRRVATAS